MDRSVIGALVAALVTACGSAAPVSRPTDAALRPPVAAVRPHPVVSPHGTRIDPYYWLRDDTRQDPEVLAYLRAENAYAAAALAPAQATEAALFAELRARVQEDDATVPVLDRGYWYYARFEPGAEHPVHARRRGTMTAPEELLLDGPRLAAGHAFYELATYEVSPDGHLLAWLDDVVGRRQYQLHIKDLRSGEVLADTAVDVSESLAWADDRTLFYVGKDPTTLREDRVLRHVVGGAAVEVFREPDEAYYVSVEPTKSRRYVQIVLSATATSEVHLIDAAAPTAPPRLLLAREPGHEYSIDHLDGRFVILSNAGARDFRLAAVAEAQVADRAAWRDLIPARPDALIEDFAVYRGFVAAAVRTGGLSKVEVRPAGGAAFFLDAAEPTYTMALLDTPDPDATAVRYRYDSLITPSSTYEVDVATRAPALLHRAPVAGHDPARYTTSYLHARAADGARVPISLVARRDTPRDGTAPLLLYAYGAYGVSSDPVFDPSVISLLDRGWVYAIAHVRGGSELGRAWYEAGKLLHKRNTFTDFIAVTEHLVAQRHAARDRVFAMGGSAGGLVMAAIANLRPELYRGIVALVPFVDVVTTMLDPSIPLVTNELDEWGDPAARSFHDYLLAYSPYDNVAARDYPSIYVRTGLWDSQVQYYEPAKWVARLRATRTDDNLVVLETDLTAGHGGASGRYAELRQSARVLAFVLHVLDRPDHRTSRLVSRPAAP